MAAGQNANPDGNESRPDGGNLQLGGRRPDGPGTAGDMAPGADGQAGIQPAGGFRRSSMGGAQSGGIPETGQRPIDRGNIPDLPGGDLLQRRAPAVGSATRQRSPGDMEGSGQRGLQPEQGAVNPATPGISASANSTSTSVPLESPR